MSVQAVLDEEPFVDNGRDPTEQEVCPPEGFYPEVDEEEEEPVPRAGPGGASQRGWGPGYPTDRRRDMAKVTVGDVSVWVHREIATIVGWLMRETERRGYRLRANECWGYCNRAIRGSTKPSNHSWGLAVDLNAPANPMSPTLRTDMPDWMPSLWTDHGFEWGGAYRGRKDAMHYEFLRTPADARTIAAKIGQPNPLPARFGEEEGTRFMYNPPLTLDPIVASMAWPGAGSILLAASGAVYSMDGAPYHGGASGQPYFAGRRAARIEANSRGGYDIISTTNERYSYP